MTEQKRYYTQVEVASYLGVNPRSLDRWNVPVIRLGKLKRYDINDVVNFLKNKKQNGNTEVTK